MNGSQGLILYVPKVDARESTYTQVDLVKETDYEVNARSYTSERIYSNDSEPVNFTTAGGMAHNLVVIKQISDEHHVCTR